MAKTNKNRLEVITRDLEMILVSLSRGGCGTKLVMIPLPVSASAPPMDCTQGRHQGLSLGHRLLPGDNQAGGGGQDAKLKYLSRKASFKE